MPTPRASCLCPCILPMSRASHPASQPCLVHLALASRFSSVSRMSHLCLMRVACVTCVSRVSHPIRDTCVPCVSPTPHPCLVRLARVLPRPCLTCRMVLLADKTPMLALGSTCRLSVLRRFRYDITLWRDTCFLRRITMASKQRSAISTSSLDRPATDTRQVSERNTQGLH